MLIVWIPLLVVAALLVTLARVIPVRIIFGYATWIDVGFSVSLFSVFLGTFSGMVVAASSGLVLALTLSAGRWLCGYQRLALRRVDGRFSVEVVDTPGWLQRQRSARSVRLRGIRVPGPVLRVLLKLIPQRSGI